MKIMANGKVIILGCSILMLIHCGIGLSQHISLHANAEIGQTLVRPHSSTTAPNSTNTVKYLPRTTTTITPPTTTTKKPGFLNSLRNIFSPGSTTTTTPKPATNFHVQNGQRAAATRTTTRKPTDEFPPLTFHNRGSAVSHIPQAVPSSTPPSAWSTTRSTTTSSTIVSAPSTSAPAIRSTTRSTTTTTTTSAPQRRPENSRPLTPAQSTSSIISLDSRDQLPSAGGSTQRPELATDAETEEISEILYRKATPNLYPFVMVNLQQRTKSAADEAPLPLLTINETILNEIPTIAKMRALFNNYEMDSTVNEYVSPLERQEENEFIDELLKTPVMKAAMKFLQDKGVVTADPKTQFDLLKTIWFNLYSRGQGKIGSCAFEHVFMNEIKNNSITGLHNWIWFYHRESEKGTSHDINYKGYKKSIELGHQKAQVIKYRFSLNNVDKPVNSMFVGTLPELDIALYTVCFEVNKSECRVSLDGNKFMIRTYPFKYRGKRLIGSAFPEI